MTIIKKIFKRLREIYSKLYSNYLFDLDKVKVKESINFDKIGIDEKKSETRLNKILNTKIGRNYNPELDSVHWKLFSGISIIKNDVK